MIHAFSHTLDLLQKFQVGQAFSLTPFEDMDFGGLKARPTNTFTRGLLNKNWRP
jgi:hypothetical protein